MKNEVLRESLLKRMCCSLRWIVCENTHQRLEQPVFRIPSGAFIVQRTLPCLVLSRVRFVGENESFRQSQVFVAECEDIEHREKEAVILFLFGERQSVLRDAGPQVPEVVSSLFSYNSIAYGSTCSLECRGYSTQPYGYVRDTSGLRSLAHHFQLYFSRMNKVCVCAVWLTCSCKKNCWHWKDRESGRRSRRRVWKTVRLN